MVAEPRIDSRVRLLVDVPEYEICRGETGIVCSTWNLPWQLIEVEFLCVITGEPKRALLNPEQVCVEDDSAVDCASQDDTCDETEDELQPA